MKIAVVGLGDVARRYVNYLKHRRDRPRLLYVDNDPDVRTRLARTGRGCAADLAQLLAEHAPDAVLVLTPPATHAAIAIEAASSGAAVVVEKPPALRRVDMEAMGAFDGVIRCIAPYRLMPVFSQACALMEADCAIDLRIRVNWPRHDQYFAKPWRSDFDRGGGPLWNTFFHHVDLAVELLRRAAPHPLAARVHCLTTRQADIELRSPAGVALLQLTTSPGPRVEQCTARIGDRLLVASGLRCSERITVDGRLARAEAEPAIVAAFTQAALASLDGSDAHRPKDLLPTVELLERIHAGQCAEPQRLLGGAFGSHERSTREG